jgi:hypothetical protein
MHAFSATIRKIDINPYVRVPVVVVRALQKEAGKARGPLRVTGTLQGKPISATIVRFRGMWRLYLNLGMRQTGRVDVGDSAAVRVRFDGTPRTEPVPRAFQSALARNPRAQAAFRALAPSRQREILRYLGHLKSPDTLARNIAKTLRFLEGGKVTGLVAVTRARRGGKTGT